MKKVFSFLSLSGVTLMVPMISLAQGFDEPGGGGAGSPFGLFGTGVIAFISTILVPLVLALAFLFFIWGVFKFFIAGGADEEKRNEGKQLMIYSIIGFVLIVALYGIVNFVVGGLGFDGTTTLVVPGVPN